MQRFRLAVVGFVAIFLAACSPPPVAVTSGTSNSAESATTSNTDPLAAAWKAGAKEQVEETWDSVVIEGAKVGHVQTLVEKIEFEGRELRRITSKTSLSMARFGETSSQQMSFGSLETASGELVAFDCRMSAGAGEMVARGKVSGDKLIITSDTSGKTQQADVEWNKEWGGFFAAEQSLRDKPLASGASRELRSLMPDFPFPSVPQVLLEALAVESTVLLAGERELLKVKQTIRLEGGQQIESFVWIDARGDALKTQLVSGLSQTTYRTTKDVALGKSSPLQFDLGRRTTVRVNQPLPNAYSTKRVIYRATLKEGNPKDAFVSGPSQSVRSIDNQTVEIIVHALRPDVPAKLETPDVPPTADDLAPSGLIQSDDQRVVALARGVGGKEQDSWKLAVALERHVKASMRSTNYSQAFATAAETAKSLEGDCTEHAMLLAAVCRARKLPARLAVGLVYDGQSGYAFHMWTEVWVSDRWIALDATRGDGGIGAAHLKLAQTNLKVSSITAALFPVFNVLGRLELEIVEVE